MPYFDLVFLINPSFLKIDVIHTVGPINSSVTVPPSSELAEKLADCYQNSLNLANDHGLKTIVSWETIVIIICCHFILMYIFFQAFPCISTGIYSYPNEEAAEVALKTVRKFLEKNTDFERVIFCVFLDKDEEIYKQLLPLHFPAN